MNLSLGAGGLTDGKPTGRTLLLHSQLETGDTVSLAGTETAQAEQTVILKPIWKTFRFNPGHLCQRGVRRGKQSSQLLKVSVND